MSLQFCPVCRGLLNIEEINGKLWSVCNCGFMRPSAIELSATEISENENNNLKKGEGIIEKDEFKEEKEKMSYEDKKENKSEF